MMSQFKNLFLFLRDWFLGLAPVSVFLLALIIPTKIFTLDFLRFVDIVMWPITILTGLFFFKKVFTYLFFSMTEFNFFGLKGNLRNINEVILEEANKKFIEKEEIEQRKLNTEKLNLEIQEKERELNATRGNAQENLDLAKSIFNNWKTSIQEKDKIINDLEEKNKRINEILSGVSVKFNPDTNSAELVDSADTSGPILEETNE